MSDPLQEADALVVLAGEENERLAYGAYLFHQGYAEWYVVTNMRLGKPNPRRTYASVVKGKAARRGVPEDRIMVVPRVVATTYEEAVATRAFAEFHGFDSLIFITSPYHTRRARWILNQVFEGTGIKVIVRPLEEYAYEPGDWWHSAAGWQHTTSEYAKLAAHILGCKHSDC